MRMWMVYPPWMCTKHRTGEHGEIHKHKHNFVKGHSFEKRVRWNQIEPTAMQSRHDELSVYLGNHKSSFEAPPKHPRYSDKDWNYKVNRDAAFMLLLTKCPACKAAFRKHITD